MVKEKVSVPAEERAGMAQSVMQLATGFWPAQVLFATHDIGVFESLSRGAATAAELAREHSLHEGATKRLLDAAVGLGLLVRTDGSYANAQLAESFLVSGRVGYMGGFIGHARNDLYPLWARLDDAVREGSPRWSQVFGAAGANPFAEMYADPTRLREFLYAMQGGSLMAVQGLLESYDFSGHTQFMDVGGALGTVSVAVAQQNPHIAAVSVDLPQVLPLAEEYVQSQGLADRVRPCVADMFEALPSGADVIHLSWILHDWSDDQCRAILARCFEALEPGGTLLVGEALLSDDADGPVFPHLMSLNMLVATDGGKERTEEEYRRLLEGAGFVPERFERLGGLRDLIVARKP